MLHHFRKTSHSKILNRHITLIQVNTDQLRGKYNPQRIHNQLDNSWYQNRLIQGLVFLYRNVLSMSNANKSHWWHSDLFWVIMSINLAKGRRITVRIYAGNFVIFLALDPSNEQLIILTDSYPKRIVEKILKGSQSSIRHAQFET